MTDEEVKKYNAEYYKAHSEEIKAKTKLWAENNPEKVKAIKDEWVQKNYEKHQESCSKWRAKNPEVRKKTAKINNDKRTAKFLAKKASQIEKQNNLCGLCNLPLPSNITKCHWDHSHTSGEYRDVLHSYCNHLVGAVEHELYAATIAYLNKFHNPESPGFAGGKQ